MARIVFLASGEEPTDRPHLLVDCVDDEAAADLVRHSNGITETISAQSLGRLLPTLLETADDEGMRTVYVRGNSEQ